MPIQKRGYWARLPKYVRRRRMMLGTRDLAFDEFMLKALF